MPSHSFNKTAIAFSVSHFVLNLAGPPLQMEAFKESKYHTFIEFLVLTVTLVTDFTELIITKLLVML
jgi:hypothetical protein